VSHPFYSPPASTPTPQVRLLSASDKAEKAMKFEPPASGRLVDWSGVQQPEKVAEREKKRTPQTPIDRTIVENLRADLESYRKMSSKAPASPHAVAAANKRLTEIQQNYQKVANEKVEKGYLPNVAIADLGKRIEAERKLLDAVQKKLPNVPGQVQTKVTLRRLIEMERVGMPLSALADVAKFNESTEEPGSRRTLGHGSTSSVESVSYKGVGRQKVYKAAEEEGRIVPCGIPNRQPRFANRNVAAWLVDQELGLNLVAETNFAGREDGVGIVMDLAAGATPNATAVVVGLSTEEVRTIEQRQNELERGDLTPKQFRSLMMDGQFALREGKWGKAVWSASKLKTSDPGLLQAVSNLEWLDKITGQVDRNPGNYLIETDGQGRFKKLTAIDNDMAFGKDKEDPGEGGRSEIDGYPILVDSKTAAKIRELGANWDRMKAKLSKYLTDDEVKATEKRLLGDGPNGRIKGLVKHVTDLEQQGRVGTDWATWTDKDGKTAYDLLSSDRRKGGFGQESYVVGLDAAAKSAQKLKAEPAKSARTLEVTLSRIGTPPAAPPSPRGTGGRPPRKTPQAEPAESDRTLETVLEDEEPPAEPDRGGEKAT
jgi:hypothetical protein